MPRIALDNSVSPAASRRRLGHELRQLREERSLRLEDVAAVLGVAPSTLSRIETGLAPTRTSYLTVILDHYGAGDTAERRRLADLARQGQRKGWWTEYLDVLPAGAGNYLGLEGAASQVEAFSALAIPSVLATSAYQVAVCQATWPDLSTSQIDLLVEVQQRRRQLLSLAGTPIHVVIDESALQRLICPTSVLTGQLKHLAAVADDASVTIQVAVLAARHQILTSSFALLSFPGTDDRPTACYNTAAGKIVVTEHEEQLKALRNAFSALVRTSLSPAQSASKIRDSIRRRATT